MDDPVQLVEFALAKGEIGEQGTISGAVTRNDFRTKVIDDPLVDRLSGLHELSSDLIG